MPLNNKRILVATTLAILMPLELMAENTEARVERLEAELQILQEQLNATADAIEGSQGANSLMRLSYSVIKQSLTTATLN